MEPASYKRRAWQGLEYATPCWVLHLLTSWQTSQSADKLQGYEHNNERASGHGLLQEAQQAGRDWSRGTAAQGAKHLSPLASDLTREMCAPVSGLAKPASSCALETEAALTPPAVDEPKVASPCSSASSSTGRDIGMNSAHVSQHSIAASNAVGPVAEGVSGISPPRCTDDDFSSWPPVSGTKNTVHLRHLTHPARCETVHLQAQEESLTAASSQHSASSTCTCQRRSAPPSSLMHELADLIVSVLEEDAAGVAIGPPPRPSITQPQLLGSPREAQQGALAARTRAASVWQPTGKAACGTKACPNGGAKRFLVPQKQSCSSDGTASVAGCPQVHYHLHTGCARCGDPDADFDDFDGGLHHGQQAAGSASLRHKQPRSRQLSDDQPDPGKLERKLGSAIDAALAQTVSLQPPSPAQRQSPRSAVVHALGRKVAGNITQSGSEFIAVADLSKASGEQLSASSSDAHSSRSSCEEDDSPWYASLRGRRRTAAKSCAQRGGRESGNAASSRGASRDTGSDAMNSACNTFDRNDHQRYVQRPGRDVCKAQHRHEPCEPSFDSYQRAAVRLPQALARRLRIDGDLMDERGNRIEVVQVPRRQTGHKNAPVGQRQPLTTRRSSRQSALQGLQRIALRRRTQARRRATRLTHQAIAVLRA